MVRPGDSVKQILIEAPDRTRVRKFFVYILRCSDGSLYTGYTVDLERRVSQHNSGRGSKYTSTRRPVELVYHERAPDLGRALKREIEIKRLKRGDKLKLCTRRGDGG